MPRNFDNWIRGYLAYTEFIEAPEIWNYWTAISTIAGALQGKCFFDQGMFEWTPNFYTLLIGPAGSGKGTAINTGMNLLKRVKGIHMGSESITWQAVIDELADATTGDPNWRRTHKPRRHSSVTYALGELGTFLDPRDKKLMSELTQLWGGDGTEDFKRRTRTEGGRTVEKPFLNLLAGTTPEWISDNLPPSLIGTGFTSRCILVYASGKKNLVAYPKRAASQDIGSLADKLGEDLASIAKLKGEFTMSEEAYAMGTAWYEQYSRQPPVGLSPDDFGGYLNRRQAHAHKCAMVISAAQSDDMVVSARHLEEAITILAATEKAMPTAVVGLHKGDEIKPYLRVEEVIKRYEIVSQAELYNRFRSKLGWRELCGILKQLEDAGLVTEVLTPVGRSVKWLGAKQDGLPN